MFKILDLYIGRTILTTVLMTVTVLMILSGMFRFIDQLRLTGRGDYDLLSAGLFTLFSVPGDLILLLAGELHKTRKQLNELRLLMGSELGLRDPFNYKPLWVLA